MKVTIPDLTDLQVQLLQKVHPNVAPNLSFDEFVPKYIINLLDDTLEVSKQEDVQKVSETLKILKPESLEIVKAAIAAELAK